MPINNVKIILDGVHLQVNQNGVVAHKAQVIDDFMPWLSRAAITSVREEDDSLGFDVTMLTGKRVRVYYGSTTPVSVAPLNNNASLAMLYRKTLQTGFDISGTSMVLSESLGFYNTYKAHQLIWAQRARLLAQIADPDISIVTKNSLITDLTALVWVPITLSLMGNSFNVFFGEGMTCQFTNWVVGNYTDFTFNLVQREPIP